MIFEQKPPFSSGIFHPNPSEEDGGAATYVDCEAPSGRVENRRGQRWCSCPFKSAWNVSISSLQ